jgi:Tol biopolymer transport system component
VAWEVSRYASLSASETGALVYAHGVTAPPAQLVWTDRAGKVLSSIGEPSQYLSLGLSPDDTKVAVTYNSGANTDHGIWVMDTTRGTRNRLTFDAGEDRWPVWSPDGLRIAFAGNRQGDWTLRQKLVNGTANDEPLLTDRDTVYGPTDWSRDGRYIVYDRRASGSGFTDIWVLPTFGDRKPFGVVQTPGNEAGATLAPNGRWMAYHSNETRQAQVFVQPFPGTGAKYQVSTNGGRQPLWREDGTELFFRTVDGTMMASSVAIGPQFKSDPPHVLFKIAANTTGPSRLYGVSRDGQRFLITVPQQDSIVTPLNVVLNWTATIQR